MKVSRAFHSKRQLNFSCFRAEEPKEPAGCEVSSLGGGGGGGGGVFMTHEYSM